MVSKHLSGPDGTFVMHPTSTTINQAGPHDWELGEWHHIIRVYALERAVYFDGELISEGDGEYLNLTTYPFMVGGWLTGDLFEHPYGPNGLTFDGGFHSMGIWNRALTSEEAFAVFLQTPILAGCTDELACNYVPDSNVDDGSCEYAENGYDCDGVCLNDADGDGVCDEFEIVGCQDPLACDYIADATDEGDCDYTCCPGPGCCDTGTTWDYEIEKCVPINSCPEDLNYDGIIGVEDLLTLLSSFGTPCGPSVAEWTCGDPVSYHGYDYETVLIGEQCWFAENLRTQFYQNGDSISGNLSDVDWSNTQQGAQAILNGDSSNFMEFGRLYNWFAIDEPHGLCPVEWHIPTDEEWIILELELGMAEVEAQSTGWRGTNEGSQMKTTYGWFQGGNGTNESGLSVKPGAFRFPDGSYGGSMGSLGGLYAYFWSASFDGEMAWSRDLLWSSSGITRNTDNKESGFSVRCIKD